MSWAVTGDRVEVKPERPALGGRNVSGLVGSLQQVSGRYLVAVPLPGQSLRESLVLVTNWQSALKK